MALVGKNTLYRSHKTSFVGKDGVVGEAWNILFTLPLCIIFIQ